MRTYLAAFFLALVLCACLTPLVRRLAMRWGAVSTPGWRHVNRHVVPRLGGIAIAVSSLAPIVTLLLVDSGVASILRQRESLLLGILLGGGALCIVGIIDDTRGLRAGTKLVAQIAVAVLAHRLGFRIDAVVLPFLGLIPMGALSLPATTLWIVAVTNAVNFIDGLDGLAAGVVFCAAATNLVVALATGSDVGPVLVGLAMVSVMGTLVGFLLYNFNPARIYMGDSGSYFLGFVLAVCSIVAPHQKASTAVALAVPMIALGLPLFDTLLSVLRRSMERRSIFAADRGHVHHRLLALGITHRRAVVTLYAISVVLSLLAVAVALGKDWEVGLALVAAAAVLFGLVRAVGLLNFVTRSESGLLPHLHTSIPGALVRLEASDSLADVEQALELVLHPRRLHRVTASTLSPIGDQRQTIVHVELPTPTLAYQTAFLTATHEVIFAGPDPIDTESAALLRVLAEMLSRSLQRPGG